MGKLKYTFILILFLIFIPTKSIQALDIQYGNIIGIDGSNVLIEYYGIEKKNDYLCNINDYKCTLTQETKLGSQITLPIKNSIKKEMQYKGATHITPTNSNKWIAYYVPAYKPKNIRSYIVKDIKKNKNYTISEGLSYWDIINEQIKVFEFSPDEKTLVYLDDRDNNMSLYKVKLDSLSKGKIKSEKIITPTSNISYFMFSDKDNLYYVGNNKENPYDWSLYHLDLRTNENTIVEHNVSYVNGIKQIGSSILFISLQEKGYGPEIYNTETKQINYFKVPNINTEKANIENEKYLKIGYSNTIIMEPKNYDSTKSYPVLIWLHGGPLRQTSLGYHPYHSYGIYDSILKLLQNNGVIVIKLDYRGSFGSGRSYSQEIKESVGKGDIDDVMNTVSYIHSKYNTSNIYLSGNSYGGYMSLKAVVDYPEAFKGVFSINGVTDWKSLLIDLKNSIFNIQFNGLPNSKNKKLYDQASIINNINNLTNQRIEIIQAGSDHTIPPWQSVLLYDKLKTANKNVNLVTYKDEDHVYKYKKNINDICIRLFNLIGITPDKECSI